jgi:hypothetical protein
VGGITLYFLAKKYEPEVRDAVVYELNQFLAVPVEVEDINLSLLQRFPYASLRFSKLTIPAVVEGKAQPDTLLFIEDLYLQIGLFDFIRKSYKVSEAEINHAYFNMKVDKMGRSNYVFWKIFENESEAPKLNLENIELNDVLYSYENEGKLWLSMDFARAKARGDFGERVFKIDLDSKTYITTGPNRLDLLFEDLDLSGISEISLDLDKDIYSLSSDELVLERQDFSVEASYNSNASQAWNLHAKSSKADLEKVQKLLPLSLQSKLADYKIKGSSNLDFNLTTNKDLDISVDFENLDAKLEHTNSKGRAEIFEGKGSLSYSETNSRLVVSSARMQMGPGIITLNGEVKNFETPDFDLAISGGMDLEAFRSFFNITQVSVLEGKLSLNGRLSGRINPRAENEKLELLKGLSFDGDISISDGALRLKGQGLSYDRIFGDFEVTENTVKLVEATARLNENEFEVEGTLHNALPYLYSRNQSLRIQAAFRADKLDFNKIWSASEEAADTSYNFQLPSNVSFELDFNVAEIGFRRFLAEQVKGTVYFKSGKMTVNPLSFATAGGSATSRIAIEDLNNGNFMGSISADIQGVEVEQLFYQFENFGQKIVKSENLEGRASATLAFSAPFDSGLEIDKRKLESGIDVTIEDGKLKDLPAFKDMIQYMRKKTLWKSVIKMNAFESELEHIEFQTLQNNILISDGKVTIPSMEVQSSAMNINISGEHSFENEISYQLNFRLSELFKIGKAESSEFGEIQDDGTGLRLFLKMSGTAENPVFSVDKEAAREKRKTQFEDEKATMKSILREEFGLFKKDSLPDVPEEKDKKTVISVEWDEFDTKSDSTSEKKKKKGKTDKKGDDIYDELEEDDDL